MKIAIKGITESNPDLEFSYTAKQIIILLQPRVFWLCIESVVCQGSVSMLIILSVIHLSIFLFFHKTIAFSSVAFTR